MHKPTILQLVTALSLGATAFNSPQTALAGPLVRTQRPKTDPQAASYTATISSGLQTKLNSLANLTDPAGVVLITFDTASGLAGVPNLDTPLTGLLAANAVVPAARLESLGIISAVLTKDQVQNLSHDTRVRSLYDNYRLKYSLHQARILCGVDKLRADATMTARNGGKVVDGAGNGSPITGQVNRPQFSVAVIDSGIDTRNTDLTFDAVTSAAGTVPTTKVIQNVQVVGDSATGTVGYSENQVNTDSVNHGSHCSGIVGGTGAFSKSMTGPTYPSAGQTEDFSGVASGVKIVGLGSGAALFVLDALGGFEYSVDNQTKYNIRVTSNSYGSEGDYDATDPLNTAIQTAYNRNITTVFAAGNSGPGVNTISSNSKSPLVITVAAGTKEGGLATFSSRGIPASERAANPTVNNVNNLIAITAPGTGREFESSGPYDPTTMGPYASGVSTPNPDTVGKKFYSDIISTRSITGTAAIGMNDQEFPAIYIPNYTMISGTSMACPFIAGTCALLLDADDTLTPDSAHPAANGRKGIKEILQATATHMPDYQDYEVGAGYVNVYAAVDLALAQAPAENSARTYVPFNRIDAPYKNSYAPFNTTVNSAPLAPPSRPIQQAGSANPGQPYPPATVGAGSSAAAGEKYTLPYNSQSVAAADYAGAKTKAQTNNNAYAFLVDANADGTPNTSLPANLRTTVLDFRAAFGNSGGAALAGGNSIGVLLYAPDGTTYSSGISLPVLDAPSRQVVVKSPVPGLWVAELRGLRGLAAVPVTPPTGVGLPDTVTGTILRTNMTVTNPPGDISDTPQRTAINTALLFNYMDLLANGTFSPKANVTRGELAQVFADNTPLRQTQGSTARFTDVSGNLGRIAEAVSVPGSTLRDFDFTPLGLMPTTGTLFRPDFFVQRIEVATALVRALGLDAEAKLAPPDTVMVTNNGTAYPIVDARELSAASRGYLQFALNRGLMDYTLAPGTFNGVNQTVAYARPNKQMQRGELAQSVVNFRARFRVGN